MLMTQDVEIRQLNSIKKNCIRLFLLVSVFICFSQSLYGSDVDLNCISKNFEASRKRGSKSVQPNEQTLVYFLYIADFANSFIEIPTSNVSGDSSTLKSSYLAGRAAIYNKDNEKVGTCSASFLNMKNADGIFTDISNYLSVDNGLIVSWFTPTKLINLELDSIIHSMVTECIVVASTKIGFNPFYGQTFNLIVSSDNKKIYFEFTRTGTIF